MLDVANAERSQMKSATRVLALIALGGGTAGAVVAVSQVPAPQAAATVAVSAPNPTSAVQQLADESAQLDVAIASAQTQLAQLSGGTATRGALGIAQSRGPPRAGAEPTRDRSTAVGRRRSTARKVACCWPASVRRRTVPTHSNRQPAPSESLSRSPADQQSAQSTQTATTPTWQSTQSPSPRPTNRGGDD